MLARANSDAGTRLRRSKSTSTAYRPSIFIPEHLDPDVAQQHAVAAAATAFVRAHLHESADRKPKRSSELSRSKSNSSRKSLTSQGSHFPARDSSFRSLQPKSAVQTAAAHSLTRASTMNTEQFPPFFPTPSSDRPLSVTRPLSTQPSITFSENSRPSTQPNPRRQSATSSATSQQIRKARSMYYASSIQTGSPIARPPAKYLTTPPSVDANPRVESIAPLPPVRLLRPSPLAVPRIPVSVTAEETINDARDKYLQSFQQKTVKHKPSMFLAPFKKRHDKGKDKVKEKQRRNTTEDTSASASTRQIPADSTTEVSVRDFQPQPGIKEKRSFSGSLKNKFKKVFRRPSYKAPNLPVQRIDASRNYYDIAQPSQSHASSAVDIPIPDEDILQRVRSRTPSFETAFPMFARSRSRTSSNGSAKSSKSNRSLHSEANPINASASRASSWGTFSTADTATQRAIKRLTVIHEAKDSLGSEADRVASMTIVKRKSLPPPALASFRDPMPLESLAEEALTPIDPKRVFSALMREIGISKPAASTSKPDRTPGSGSDVFESSETKELHSSASRDLRSSLCSDQRPPLQRPTSAAAQSAQSKNGTIRSLGRKLRSTIRTVTPAEQHSSPCPGRSVSVRGAVRIPREELETPSSTSSFESQLNTIGDQAVGSSGFKYSKQMEHSGYHAEVFSPSIGQIAKRAERDNLRWQSPLQDVAKTQYMHVVDGSGDFPGLDEAITSIETSFQTAPRVEALRADLHRQGARNSRASPKSPASPDPGRIMSPLSPSIYSRNTDGISIFPNDSVMSFGGQAELKDAQDNGSAVILTSQSVRSYVIGTPSPRRPDSTRTSRDWKAWLSHEISGMEFTSQEDLQFNDGYMPSTEQHEQDVGQILHADDTNKTVILRSISEMSETQSVVVRSVETVVVEAVPSRSEKDGVEQQQVTPRPRTTVIERPNSDLDTFKEVSPEQTPSPPTSESARARGVYARSETGPRRSQQRPIFSTNRTSASSQPLPETPKSERMNDRFPFIDTGRRSSSYSGRSSRKSKSPPDSVASSSLKSEKAAKETPSPTIYSDLSDPTVRLTLEQVPEADIRPSDDAPQTGKENMSPPSLRQTSKLRIPSLRMDSQRKSLQPLSSSALNSNMAESSPNSANSPDTKRLKHTSSPVTTSTRPLIRATLRPISPDKLSRRPRSALDLNRPYYLSTPRAIHAAIPSTPTPKAHTNPEQSGEAQSHTPSTSLALNKEPNPGEGGRGIDGVLDGESPRILTPGQRMADRFLRGRKSTPLLEGGRVRGGMRLAREDTPAFL